MAEIWGVALAGAAVAAGASVYGANEQAGAAKNAQGIAENQYNNTVGLENPYNSAGVGAQNELNYLLGTGAMPAGGTNTTAGGSLLSPFTASMMQQYSPAYQFQLQQGKQGVLNGDSSSQGGLSGAALQGLTDYNQSEANTAFASANNIYQNQQSNIYQRLAGVANTGQSAASGTATAGNALAGSAAQSATNVGTAYANGANGVGNSINSGANNASIYAMYGGGGQNTNPNNLGGSTAVAPAGSTLTYDQYGNITGTAGTP